MTLRHGVHQGRVVPGVEVSARVVCPHFPAVAGGPGPGPHPHPPLATLLAAVPRVHTPRLTIGLLDSNPVRSDLDVRVVEELTHCIAEQTTRDLQWIYALVVVVVLVVVVPLWGNSTKKLAEIESN